jgi:hypothetical protein
MRSLEERHEREAALRALADYLKVVEERAEEGWRARVEALANLVAAGHRLRYAYQVAPLMSELRRSGRTEVEAFIAEVERAFNR